MERQGKGRGRRMMMGAVKGVGTGQSAFERIQHKCYLKCERCSLRALRDGCRKNITPAAPTNNQPHYRLLWE